MGLLDLFKSHADEPSLQKAKSGDFVDITIYDQMRVEVTAFNSGQLFFLAKFMYPKGTTASLYQIGESSLPEDTKPVKAHIRGYHEQTKKAIYVEGMVSSRGAPIWRVENLVIDHVGNDRSFFRLDLNVGASVTKFGGQDAGEEFPCKLLNISVGGTRIMAAQRFWEGDRLLLNVRLPEGGSNSVIFCKVLRVIEKSEGLFEYGCQFMELTEADEDKITQSIFALQRKMRNGR